MKLKLEHLWWILLLVFVAIGWEMHGVTDFEKWISLFSLMAFGNLVFAALWLIERGKVKEMRRLLDPKLQRHFR